MLTGSMTAVLELDFSSHSAGARMAYPISVAANWRSNTLQRDGCHTTVAA
ncbi:MAG: hypothetical protein GW808_07580 [Sphingomonadales bacterium]|nr:hypothetical protein [Sphingomonadales bacterium]NCO50139.1 hypothetical protein [Sphingomonadales bacterium]NCP01025.1 hypothetical protein [Sphingomonadales bacterium]NCP26388.1 hypothetical protein [Sphingomonadales bacterium]NCP43514.1 hypothetical protein [Sphingomonadales bacterium]